MSLCHNQTSRFTWKAFWFWFPTGISFAVSSLNAYNTMLYWQYWEGQGVHMTIHILCFVLFLAWRLFRRQYCHQPLSSAQQSSHRSKYIQHGIDTPAYHQHRFENYMTHGVLNHKPILSLSAINCDWFSCVKQQTSASTQETLQDGVGHSEATYSEISLNILKYNRPDLPFC